MVGFAAPRQCTCSKAFISSVEKPFIRELRVFPSRDVAFMYFCVIQAWRAVHPPSRGSCWRRPLVHEGFLKSWHTNGLAERVIDRVRSILKSSEVDVAEARVIVTGNESLTLQKWTVTSKRCACCYAVL
jgi:hypothetical protein